MSSVLWCRLRFRIETMFASPLPPVVCRRIYVLFTLFVFVQHILTIWVWEEGTAYRSRPPGLTMVFGGVPVLLIVLAFCVVLCLFLFVFVFVFVLCGWSCRFLWIIHSVLPFQFSLEFIHSKYHNILYKFNMIVNYTLHDKNRKMIHMTLMCINKHLFI